MAATQRYAPLAPNATILAPDWAGSCLDRDALMPGGLSCCQGPRTDLAANPMMGVTVRPVTSGQ